MCFLIAGWYTQLIKDTTAVFCLFSVSESWSEREKEGGLELRVRPRQKDRACRCQTLLEVVKVFKAGKVAEQKSAAPFKHIHAVPLRLP